MPSTNQGGDTRNRMRCPQLVDTINEDPARWLDWDLLADQDRAAMVRTLIDGIDTFERLRAWRAVERKLANEDQNDEARHPLDEPRDAILHRLDQREQWLELHGERPGRLPFGPRESCECCDADGFVTAAELRERVEEDWARRSDGYSTDGADTSETSPATEETSLGAFATDGGESA